MLILENLKKYINERADKIMISDTELCLVNLFVESIDENERYVPSKGKLEICIKEDVLRFNLIHYECLEPTSLIVKRYIEDGFDIDGSVVHYSMPVASACESEIKDVIDRLLNNYSLFLFEKQEEDRKKQCAEAKKYLQQIGQDVDQKIKHKISLLIIDDMKKRLLSIKMQGGIYPKYKDLRKKYFSDMGILERVEGETPNRRLNQFLFKYYRIGDPTMWEEVYSHHKVELFNAGLLLTILYYAEAGFTAFEYKRDAKKMIEFERILLKKFLTRIKHLEETSESYKESLERFTEVLKRELKIDLTEKEDI